MMLWVALVCALGVRAAGGQMGPRDVVRAMIENENRASAEAERYGYLSVEKSGRTGGHVWVERVVETAPGRVRLLIEEDGKPLSGDRLRAERERVQRIEEHPEEFVRHEQGTRVEEKRARGLMEVLPKDYLFEDVRLEDGVWKMNFRPDPSYKPDGIEERILHNMAGRLEIDAKQLRLIHMDFHLVQDVAIGFGLLADVHTGTTFVSDRQVIEGRWHTTHVATQVRAKAVLFKTVDLNLELQRTDFKPVNHDLTVPEAAAMLLRGRE
jgi:hypothetical protein